MTHCDRKRNQKGFAVILIPMKTLYTLLFSIWKYHFRSRDNQLIIPSGKFSILFRDMRTHGDHNSKVRFWISCPSAENVKDRFYMLWKFQAFKTSRAKFTKITQLWVIKNKWVTLTSFFWKRKNERGNDELYKFSTRGRFYKRSKKLRAFEANS